MANSKYTVVIQWEDGYYVARVQELPSLHFEAESVDELEVEVVMALEIALREGDDDDFGTLLLSEFLGRIRGSGTRPSRRRTRRSFRYGLR